jgi:hypothetical protein
MAQGRAAREKGGVKNITRTGGHGMSVSGAYSPRSRTIGPPFLSAERLTRIGREAGAAAAQGVPRERISFVDALRPLRWPLAATASSDLWVNPLRPDRYEPRVRERRPPEYSLLTQSHAALRKALRRNNDAA